MGKMSFWEKSYCGAMGLASFVSLSATIYLAISDRPGSAAVTGAVFLSSAVLTQFSRLELFEGFGIKAKLSKTLDEAQEITSRLREQAVANARLTFLTVAWQNRWGSPNPKDLQNALDDTMKSLAALSVSEQERSRIAAPLVRFIGRDLFNHFFDLLSKQYERKRSATTDQDSRKDLEKAHQHWQSSLNISYRDDVDFKKIVRGIVADAGWLTDEERTKALGFGDYLANCFETSRLRNGYSSEAQDFFRTAKKDRSLEKKVVEVFG